MEKRNTKQAGFTLIELMIGMLVGLVAVAATISAFSSIVRSNSDYLKMVRLNQELNAVMTLMTRDLKRAGYSASADGKTNNNITMTTTGINGVDLYIQPDCVTFTYDADGDGSLDDPGERFGYRHDSVNQTVEAKDVGIWCDQGNWEDITDNDIINITNLNFTDDSLYLTTSTALPPEIRYIGITLTGQLAKDPTVTRTLTERVRIRNDRP